jgi:hypothetical protein
MVVSPLLRGLFGLDWDTARKQLSVNPQLPANWNQSKLRHLQMGDTDVTLEIERTGAELRVKAITQSPQTLCLSAGPLPRQKCATPAAVMHAIDIPLPSVELGIPAQLPDPGDVTRQLKTLDQHWTEHNATFTFEAQANARYDLPIRLNRPGIKVEGAQIKGNALILQFPTGQGYVKKMITFEW